MFVDKYKVHPIENEDDERAETFESKAEAEKRCEELNKEGDAEWKITFFMENQGF